MRAAMLMLVAAACAGAPARKVPMRDTPWSLVYADGSANVYRFEQPAAGAPVAFEYVPVTPEQSSTGSYSGGDPVELELAAGDPRIDELWRRVEALEKDTAIHTPDRAKRTGQFGVRTPAGERDFIVDFTPQLETFHAFVAGFRKRVQ